MCQSLIGGLGRTLRRKLANAAPPPPTDAGYVHPYLAKISSIEAQYHSGHGQHCPFGTQRERCKKPGLPKRDCPFGALDNSVRMHTGLLASPDGKQLGMLETPFWNLEPAGIFVYD
uniref:Uncharacterized protein n=1 Tax=Eutreptiella gymnastica TaxID=73025 RepID=A0A6U8KJP3_9EUGL|mmetsp:Transcript_71766/g.126379  ORF Transcript_71766/g.126379 Transcript_71766/m.126379 type:complete len:116 (+) Transcript_71766:117-464(+)